jgi:hypothetical protein
MSLPDFFLSSHLKSVLIGQFVGAEEVSMEMTVVLREASKGNAAKNFYKHCKSVSLPEVSIWSKYYVNRCMVAYFYMVHQFREPSEPHVCF